MHVKVMENKLKKNINVKIVKETKLLMNQKNLKFLLTKVYFIIKLNRNERWTKNYF
jgi:hypothetical protein